MDPLTMGAESAGASTVSSLADRIFGRGDPERIKRLIAYLQNRMERDVMSQGEQRNISDRAYYGRMGEFNRNAEAFAKKAGIDSGVTQNLIHRDMRSQRFATDAELAMLNKRLTQQRDMTLLPTMAGLERSIYG